MEGFGEGREGGGGIDVGGAGGVGVASVVGDHVCIDVPGRNGVDCDVVPVAVI